jgi:hypothetical protein
MYMLGTRTLVPLPEYFGQIEGALDGCIPEPRLKCKFDGAVAPVHGRELEEIASYNNLKMW